MNNIILTINFNIIHDRNHINAQNAGLIDFCMFFLCRNSHISAHQNGHKIKPNGQENIQITIQIIHHRFHRLLHQNFLVHNIGR